VRTVYKIKTLSPIKDQNRGCSDRVGRKGREAKHGEILGGSAVQTEKAKKFGQTRQEGESQKGRGIDDSEGQEGRGATSEA